MKNRKKSQIRARSKYDQTVAPFDGLDKKPDELMRTAATIAALLVEAIKALEVAVTPCRR